MWRSFCVSNGRRVPGVALHNRPINTAINAKFVKKAPRETRYCIRVCVRFCENPPWKLYMIYIDRLREVRRESLTSFADCLCSMLLNNA